jgi:hypothetical protein
MNRHGQVLFIPFAEPSVLHNFQVTRNSVGFLKAEGLFRDAEAAYIRGRQQLKAQ